MGANIEIKPCRGREVETAWQVCEIAREVWPTGRGRLLLSSFALESLRAAAEIAPRLPRGLLVESLPRRWRELMDELDCLTLHASQRRVADASLAAVIGDGVPVVCYTVNHANRARRLAELGVAALISDVPDLVAGALQ
jgi:glycerophosphoryl diester phosphodiesterase